MLWKAVSLHRHPAGNGPGRPGGGVGGVTHGNNLKFTEYGF